MSSKMTGHMDASKYLKVCIMLLALTALTLAQPYIITTSVATTVGIQMVIALAKTFLILAYYMHLKYESKLFAWIVYGSIFVLLVSFILVGIDIVFRNQATDIYGL